MTRTRTRIVLSLALAAGAVACDGGKKKDGPSAAAVTEAWKKRGVDPGALAEVKVDLGEEGKDARCKGGTLDGVDVTLCELPTPEAARKAEAAGLKLVGDTTGVSLSRGRLLLVLADRKNADPNGKRMNQLAQDFRHAK